MPAETLQITPAKARQLLQRRGMNNDADVARVEMMATKMIAGRWDPSQGKPIAQWETGELADGQHRLLAIVAADKIVPMRFVTWPGQPKRKGKQP